jgi:hypothetical protein
MFDFFSARAIFSFWFGLKIKITIMTFDRAPVTFLKNFVQIVLTEASSL